MKFDDLTEGQKAKAQACKTPEEVLALAKEEGYELSDDELEAVSGGWLGDKDGGPLKRL
ncbi:MAG: Nif11-like leader peptide family natural product precursor [Eggerthellaceae bacterium]|nr:Nif11-like leader peptide family natural product precursor [Eggerthellaceae bacterium]